MLPTLQRSTKVEGRSVTWQNAIGMHVGQGGTYEFATEHQAQEFAEYAEGENPPSLAPEVLEEHGWQVVSREER